VSPCGNKTGAPPTGASHRDLLARPIASALAWWLPQLGIAAALLAPTPLRTAVWTIALVWTGAACIVNAAQCGRTHCRYTGPFYLVLIVPTLVAGWTDARMAAWIALAALILIGGKVIWWVSERAWGRYGEAAN